MIRPRAALVALLGAFQPACGPSPGGTSSSVTTTTTATATGTTTTGATPTGPGSTAEDSAGDDPTASDSASFAAPPDMPGPGVPCDPWQDSCPEGQKCKPYAPLGPWEGASCVPVADPPTPIGEACEGDDATFVDECVEGAVCHALLAPEGRRCHELCGGSLVEPTCSDPCSWCFSNGGFAGVCLFPCDPRASECPEGQVCQMQPDLPRFVCALGPGPSLTGETCSSPGWCAEGTACVDAALVPNCAGDRCCAPVCDLDGPDPCPDALPGTTCSPWPMSAPSFEPACLPAGLGLCAAG